MQTEKNKATTKAKKPSIHERLEINKRKIQEKQGKDELVQVVGIKDQPDGYYRLAAAGSQYADTAFSSADLAVGVAGAFRKNGQMPPFFQPFGGFGEHVIVGVLGICGGKGSHEPDKTAENGVPEQGLLGDKVERVRGSHCYQHRIQIAAVVGGEDDGSALRDIFPPLERNAVVKEKCDPHQIIGDAVKEKDNGIRQKMTSFFNSNKG